MRKSSRPASPAVRTMSSSLKSNTALAVPVVERVAGPPVLEAVHAGRIGMEIGLDGPSPADETPQELQGPEGIRAVWLWWMKYAKILEGGDRASSPRVVWTAWHKMKPAES